MTSKLQNLLPFAAMVVSSCLYTGIKVVSKVAMMRGMSSYVFVVYSTGLSALLFVPALLLSLRPPLTFPMLVKFFTLGLIGMALNPNLLLTGINYTSPTLASAISNLGPALTFLLAVIFRMEKLDMKRFVSQVKIIGTIVSVMGALTMTLCKSLSSTTSISSTLHQLFESHRDWVLGGFCLVLASFCNSGSNILQASVLKRYPFEISVMFFCTLIGSILSAAISFIVERNVKDAWKLNFDIKLVALLCVAGFNSVASYIVAWCIGKKGPVFVAMFGPMGIVIAATLSAIFLGDRIDVGSAVGAVIIVLGFYAVVWAKSKEMETDQLSLDHLQSPSSQKMPLLENQNNQ